MKFGEIGVYTVPETPCLTPHGPGHVVQYEVAYGHWVRFGVVLEKNPLGFSPAFYRPDQVTGYLPAL